MESVNWLSGKHAPNAIPPPWSEQLNDHVYLIAQYGLMEQLIFCLPAHNEIKLLYFIRWPF
jgi:hypothetical protein